MNNRERFMTALKLGEPDRVPIFDLGFNEESILNVGKHFTSDLPPLKPLVDCSVEEMVKLLGIQIQFTRELDLDAMNCVFFTGRKRMPGGKDLLQDRYGIVYKLSKHGEPFPVDGPVKGPEDLKTFKVMIPDPADFIMLKFVRGALPERAVLLTLPGTFRFSWSVMGAMERLLLAYIEEPEFALDLARITTDFAKGVVEAGIREGAEVIILEGDLAHKTSTLMSPGQYRRFLKPFHREIVEAAHKGGVSIIKHTDGNIWPILDDLLEVGFDGIHPIQPQCMDIAEVKKHVKGKACVLGNIDCTYALPFGTKEEVVEIVKETIRKAAPGGGYILSSSNSVHPGCKGENVVAMFEAAKKYGVYPIKI
jgi:uroporphyrinogen decarboxylase